ncbi:hypothetical protein, partial [Salmonella enterica]
INLKRDVDIINPRLILIPNLPTGFSGINYAEIPLLNRFYFVDSITNISSTLWQLDLSCDVLETYKADILASKARLYRNLKAGDYFNTALESSHLTTVAKYAGTKGISEGESLILTSVGVK